MEQKSMVGLVQRRDEVHDAPQLVCPPRHSDIQTWWSPTGEPHQLRCILNSKSCVFAQLRPRAALHTGRGHMGTVSDACGRRKRGYATAPPDASTHGSTVYRGRNHSQAAWYGHHATPWWQVPACVVVASLPQPAEQRAASETHITTNAAGYRCGGHTSATRHTARNGHHLVQ